MINRIRYTCIFCYALICKINLSVLIKSNIFKKRISLDRIVDIRLGLFIQVDYLGIASTFKIEDAVVIPAMLIVSNQKTFWICRKCCFSGSGKSEEDCCIFTVHISVCRTVHGSNPLQRKVIVHHGEHTLLHFSAVPCIDNNLLTTCDIEHNSCLGIQSKLFVVFNFRFGSIIYDEIRLEIFKLFFRRLDKHIRNKVCLPCHFHNKTDRHTCILVSSAERIDNEQSLS